MKKNIITIDLNKWTTQVEKARISGIPLSTLSYRVKRTLEGKTKSPIETMEIPELNITLVRKNADL